MSRIRGHKLTLNGTTVPTVGDKPNPDVSFPTGAR